MPRPRRFTSQYGKFTRKQFGFSQYRYKVGSGAWSGWVGSATPKYRNPEITSVRLVPVPSDFVKPTNWGAVAEYFSAPAFSYLTRNGNNTYEFRGEGDTTTMGLPSLVYAGLGSVSSSGTVVAVSLPSGLSAAANNAARNGLANQHLNLLVVFGEARESIRTLADLSVRIFRSFRHARKGRWRRALEALNGGKLRSSQHLAENYAAYFWGLLPMLNDAYGLQEQIKNGITKTGTRFKTVGFRSKSVPASQLWGTYSPSTHSYSGTGGRAFSRVVYTAGIKSDELYLLNQLGIANPISAIWELIPLSFVIDWFLPIGDFLSAVTAPLGTEFVSGFEDKVIEVNVSCLYCRYGFANYISGSMQTLTWQYFAFERTKLASFQPARLYLGSGLTNSVQRVISSVALMKLRAR